MEARGGVFIGSGATGPSVGTGSGSTLNSRMPQQRTIASTTKPVGRAAPTTRVVPQKPAAGIRRSPLTSNNSHGDHSENSIDLQKLEEMDSRVTTLSS